jgi:hypothetical protein
MAVLTSSLLAGRVSKTVTTATLASKLVPSSAAALVAKMTAPKAAAVVAPKAAAPGVVAYSQLAGGWRVDDRGAIYTTKALAEAAARGGPLPVTDTFELHTGPAVTVARPPETAAQKAEREKQALIAHQKAQSANAAAIAVRNIPASKKIAESNAAAIKSNNEFGAWQREHMSGIDWGLLPAAAAIIGGTIAVVVTAGAAAPALMALGGGITAGTAATAVTSVVAVGAAANQLIKEVKDTPSMGAGTERVMAAGDLILEDPQAAESARLVADNLLALKERGSKEATRLITDAIDLGKQGVPGAATAAAVFKQVQAERLAKAVPLGVVQLIDPTQTALLARVKAEAAKMASVLAATMTPATATAATRAQQLDVALTAAEQPPAAAPATSEPLYGIVIPIGGTEWFDMKPHYVRGVSTKAAGIEEGVVFVLGGANSGRLDYSTRFWERA